MVTRFGFEFRYKGLESQKPKTQIYKQRKYVGLSNAD